MAKRILQDGDDGSGSIPLSVRGASESLMKALDDRVKELDEREKEVSRRAEGLIPEPGPVKALDATSRNK